MSTDNKIKKEPIAVYFNKEELDIIKQRQMLLKKEGIERSSSTLIREMVLSDLMRHQK